MCSLRWPYEVGVLLSYYGVGKAVTVLIGPRQECQVELICLHYVPCTEVPVSWLGVESGLVVSEGCPGHQAASPRPRSEAPVLHRGFEIKTPHPPLFTVSRNSQT